LNFFSSLPHQRLARDASFQSDSSHCSSVESLLELRKADPAAILLDLGFGGSSASPQENGTISRIPRRFLQPSSLRGIAIDEFLKQQQETTESFDSVSLGYRGLTGKMNFSALIIRLFKKIQLFLILTIYEILLSVQHELNLCLLLGTNKKNIINVVHFSSQGE